MNPTRKLWAPADVQRELGVHKSTFYWWQDHGFPARVKVAGPWRLPKTPPLYDEREVRAWYWDRTNRRPLLALLAYRKHGTLAAAARAGDCDRKTVKRWLTQLGEIETAAQPSTATAP